MHACMTYPYSTGASIVGQNMKHPSFLCIHDLTQRFYSEKSTKKINHIMRREPTLPYRESFARLGQQGVHARGKVILGGIEAIATG